MGFIQDALSGVGNAASGVGSVVGGLFKGGPEQTQASSGFVGAPPAAPKMADQQAAINAVLHDYGWDQNRINGFWALDDVTQQKTFASTVTKAPPVDTSATKQYLMGKGYDETALAGLTPPALQALAKTTILKTGKTALFDRGSATKTLSGAGVPEADIGGMTDATIQHLTQTMYDQQLRAKKTGQPIDRQALANAAPPEVRDLILNTPEGALGNLVSTIAANKLRTTKAPTGKPAFDRGAALSRIDPEYRDRASGLNDEQLSGELNRELQASQKTAKTRSGIKYIPGASLKIVQDADFARSGLKSGDTVCIKIP